MATTARYVGTTTAEALAYVRTTVGSEDDFLRVFDRDGDGEIASGSADETAFVRAVCSAETEIDEALAASHGAPFTGTVPDSVREIAALRCLWCAVRTRAWNDTEKAPFRVLYKDTDTRLSRLASDTQARIPARGVPEPTATAAGIVEPDASTPAASWSPLGVNGF